MTPPRLELGTLRLEISCSIQLSYGAALVIGHWFFAICAGKNTPVQEIYRNPHGQTTLDDYPSKQITNNRLLYVLQKNRIFFLIRVRIGPPRRADGEIEGPARNCRGAEIGRQAGLRIQCPKGHESSSLSRGTGRRRAGIGCQSRETSLGFPEGYIPDGSSSALSQTQDIF